MCLCVSVCVSLLVEMVLDDAVFLNSAVLHVQGDFVDRGFNSLEVFTILLLLKARYLSTFLFGIVNVLFVCSKALTFLAHSCSCFTVPFGITVLRCYITFFYRDIT